MPESLTGRVVVPVANEDDARETATALEPYDIGDVTVVHVVEKGAGVPDKTPVEQSESVAEDAFSAFRSVHPAARTRTAYGRDVVQRIVDVADDVDATAIAFLPRGGNRIVQFLAGDRSLRLVTEADHPVVSLARPDASDDA
ncbi:universal stress protein [Halorubellus litoreus]|uniref:Universal stress protein n=1 Tax=Halorubellus litoreus TaxID=755308 RepID=A0ABD5VMJ2_9EURY